MCGHLNSKLNKPFIVSIAFVKIEVTPSHKEDAFFFMPSHIPPKKSPIPFHVATRLFQAFTAKSHIAVHTSPAFSLIVSQFLYSAIPIATTAATANIIPPIVAIIGSIATFSAAASPVRVLTMPSIGEIAATSASIVKIKVCVPPSRFANHSIIPETVSTSFSSLGNNFSASVAPTFKNDCCAFAFNVSNPSLN